MATSLNAAWTASQDAAAQNKMQAALVSYCVTKSLDPQATDAQKTYAQTVLANPQPYLVPFLLAVATAGKLPMPNPTDDQILAAVDAVFAGFSG